MDPIGPISLENTDEYKATWVSTEMSTSIL